MLSSVVVNSLLCTLITITTTLVSLSTGKKQIALSLISDVDNDISSIAGVNVDVRKDHQYFKLVGHHNGIICLSDYWNNVVLCNPAMREFRVLPSSCILKPSDPHVVCYDKSVGFSYDCQTNDFKVVMNMKYWHELLETVSPRVEVYNLSTDSWREIQDVQLGAVILNVFNFQMHFNGVYYWWAHNEYNRNNSAGDHQVILSFDLGNEVFQKIPMPDFSSDEYERKYNTRLIMFNESITLIHYQDNKKSLDFWVMDEFGVNGTWTKLFSIGPLPGIEMPLVCWKNNELLMKGRDAQVISYNLKTQEIRNLPIHGIPKMWAAAIYVNSLVSIKAP